jgi:hypothetical protein
MNKIMESTKPIEISLPEWKEIMSLPEVREDWGLDDEITPKEFASKVYGVKFHFISGSPGYVGDLYILKGDGAPETIPMTIIRKEGKLKVVYE